MARIFSVVWILFGLIAMAIFMAYVTTALTALSLQLEPTSLRGVQVTFKKYHSMRVNSLVFLITNNNTGQNIPVHLSNVCSFNDKG